MNDFIDFRRVLVTVLKRWWLLALAIAIGAGLGYIVAQRQAKVYQATTTLLVGQIANSSDLNRTDILAGDLVAKTYKEMIGREPILQAVVDSLDLNLSWQQLSKNVKANLVEGTQLLQITVEANTPDSARIVADEVARQLMLFSPTVVGSGGNGSEQPFVQEQLNSLQSRIESGQSKLAALETEMKSTDSVDRLNQLQTEASDLEGMITDWQNNYTQLLGFLQNGQSVNQLSVVEPARANPNPIRPQIKIYMMVATVLAIFSTLALIFALEYFNNTIRTGEEITREFGLPILGNIDDARQYRGNKKSVYAYKFLLSPLAEAYRSLRANLEVIGAGKSVKSILITSCDAGVGKSSVAANLAAFLAQAGKRVVLVDADLRKPSLHEMMNLPNGVGLSNMVSNGTSLAKALQSPNGDRLRVITAGAPANPESETGSAEISDSHPQKMNVALALDPSEILASEKVTGILGKLEKDSDLVILDSPPFIVSDALILASKVDGVLLVIEPGQTRKKSLSDMLEQLNRAEARVIGVVLNHISASNARKMKGLPYPSGNHAAGGHPINGNGNGYPLEAQNIPPANSVGSPIKRFSARLRKRENGAEGTSALVEEKIGRNGSAATPPEMTGEPPAGANRKMGIRAEQIEEMGMQPEGTMQQPELPEQQSKDADTSIKTGLEQTGDQPA